MNTLIFLLSSYAGITSMPGALGILELPAYQFADCNGEVVLPQIRTFADAGMRSPRGTLMYEAHQSASPCRYGNLYWLDEGGQEPAHVPVVMFAYERLGPVVTAVTEDAYRIQLSDGAVWVASESVVFHPVEQLFARGGYFVADRTFRFCREPNVNCQTLSAPTGNFSDTVITETTLLEGRRWAKVILHRVSHCLDALDLQRIEATGRPSEVTGWIPLHGEDGLLNVWFWAKGC